MQLRPADPSDLPAIAALVNSAYRGDSARQGWTSEAHLLGGQRTDADTLALDLRNHPGSLLLLAPDDDESPLASVWLQPGQDGAWYLGMLTVRPDRQNDGLGARILAAAEDFARDRGASRMTMTVIASRRELIAWYERRGYRRTGATQPFPYGDERFGIPLVGDLVFEVLEKPL